MLLAWLVALAYWPVLGHDFIIFDDSNYITNNDIVRSGLNSAGVRWAFSTTANSNWHPLTWLSHELDCQLFGLRAWGHHLTGLLFHTANTLLLFLVMMRATGARWRSFMVAALFGLHPIHVESVAWVAERKDVLSTFFFLLTLLAYCGFAEFQRNAALRTGISCLWYCLALLLFALGLMCKQMLVTLPFVLLLLDYWPLQRTTAPATRGAKSGRQQGLTMVWIRLIAEKTPFFVLAAIASDVVFSVQKQGGAMQQHLSFVLRLENALIAYCRYLSKLFWPTKLSVFYPLPAHPWPIGLVLLAGLLLCATTFTALVYGRQRNYLPVGWFWFVGTLVPVIGIVQVGAQAMADRYAYIPSIGIYILVSWGLWDAMTRWRFRTLAGAGLMTAAILACVMATRRELGYWRNGETLFRRALAVTPANSVSLTCLGEELVARKDLDEAIRYFRQAVQLSPNYAKPRVELGYVLIEKGQTDEAMFEFEEAVKSDSGNADAHNGLGATLIQTGRLDQAVAEYRAALKVAPRNAEAHGNLGLALAQTQHWPEAIREFQLALELRPGDPEIHDRLGDCLCHAGQLDEGISQFREALRLQPNYADAQEHLAAALAAKPEKNGGTH